jgi:hypothetical protein
MAGGLRGLIVSAAIPRHLPVPCSRLCWVRSIEATRLMREINWSLPLAMKRLENASSTLGLLGMRSELRSIRDAMADRYRGRSIAIQVPYYKASLPVRKEGFLSPSLDTRFLPRHWLVSTELCRLVGGHDLDSPL